MQRRGLNRRPVKGNPKHHHKHRQYMILTVPYFQLPPGKKTCQNQNQKACQNHPGILIQTVIIIFRNTGRRLYGKYIPWIDRHGTEGNHIVIDKSHRHHQQAAQTDAHPASPGNDENQPVKQIVKHQIQKNQRPLHIFRHRMGQCFQKQETQYRRSEPQNPSEDFQKSLLFQHM